MLILFSDYIIHSTLRSYTYDILLELIRQLLRYRSLHRLALLKLPKSKLMADIGLSCGVRWEGIVQKELPSLLASKRVSFVDTGLSYKW